MFKNVDSFGDFENSKVKPLFDFIPENEPMYFKYT